MAELKDYTTNVNGMETTLRLSEEDAKARGLKGGTPADTPDPAAAEPDAGTAEKAAPAPANKSRTASTNK